MTAALTHQHVDDCPVWTLGAYVALMFAHMQASAEPGDCACMTAYTLIMAASYCPVQMLKKTMVRCTCGQHLSVVAISE